MRNKDLLITIGIIVLVLVILGGMYNGLVKRDVAVTTAWAQVENVLQRRADLIPNLVSSVKGYMKHEQEILDNLAKARASYTGAQTVDEKMKAGALMEGALARLLAIVENYPSLKANETFNRLMDELAGTENRIAVERKKYNEAVQDLNTTIRRVPWNIIANFFKFQAKPFFEAEAGAKAVPKVDFGTEN
ncbi:MAG: LemA family protein [Elusimicrobiota bacterium]